GMLEHDSNDLNTSCAALIAHLAQLDARVQISIGNALWHRPGLSLVPALAHTLREQYGATVGPLDFAAPHAAGVVNAWVRQATLGLIPPVPLDYRSPVLLVNAIGFKGAWTMPFDPSRTQVQPFSRANGQDKPMPMMAQGGKYEYAETEEFQLVRLPYGE